MNNILQNQEFVNLDDYFSLPVYGRIYKITNLITGKFYIGQTIKNIHQRFHNHINDSKKPKTYIHRAMNKYGIENFIIEEIDIAYSLDELNQKEYEWIVKENCLSPNGYNLRNGGNYPGYSDETRKKISETNKNKFSIYNENTNEIIYINKGDEIPENYIIGRPKGNKRSPEAKQNIIASHQNMIWIFNKQTNERHLIKQTSSIPEGFDAHTRSKNCIE